MADPIRHVIVLMMENRSFDHLLGDLDQVKPGLDGIRNARAYLADPRNQNRYPEDAGAVPLSPNALPALDKSGLGDRADFDPRHEFLDVKAQLGGDLAAPRMSGFVQDAFAAYQGKLDPARRRNTLSQVMAYFPAAPPAGGIDPIPALHGLAKEFLVCDHWFSSLPGPTWPNRFFALMGTSMGNLRMPEGTSHIGPLFRDYDRPTIFNRVRESGRSCRIYYHDVSLTLLLRQTWFLPGLRRRFQDDFARDVAAADPRTFPDFVFVEPRYFSGLFGQNHPNDQHPPHDVLYGDNLIADVYNALRANDPLWQETLLVVVYDEHGGFFDHVEPPQALPPDDLAGPGSKDADLKFGFDRLGVRVPAVLASPWVANGVDPTFYDHTSLLAYLCRKWELEPLGNRCRQAMAKAPFSAVFEEHARATPASLPRGQTKATRALAAAPVLNGNQRALAAMVDFLAGYLNVANRASSLRSLEGGEPVSLQGVERKIEEIESALRPRAAGSSLGAALPGTPAAGPEAKGASPEPRREAGPRQPLRVLMVHGIGHGDDPAGRAWTTAWEEAFRESARLAGIVQPDRIEFDFARFDPIFETYPLDPFIIARGLGLLLGNLGDASPILEIRDLAQRGASSVARWTAGMALQWIESPRLRDELNAALMEQFQAKSYDIVCAHSLGGMACYDAFRRAVAAGRAGAFEGTSLLTFGSQLAHPAVQSVFGGRIEPLYDATGAGFSQWFHLYNPKDRLFTRPLPGEDARTHTVETIFEIPGDVLNHSGEYYLKSMILGRDVLPHLLPGLPAGERSLPPAPAVRRTRRRALLVGINDYPDPALRLNGCVNDVYLVSAVLQECGFDAGDIRVLTDRRATREALLERLEWLSEGVAGGDERVFFYSGHGAQLDSYGAEGEPDHREETLVPADFDWSPGRAFTDKEFQAYYSRFPYDATFLAILDCCHAGGMTRGGLRVKGINPPDDLRHRELRWSPRHQMWVPRDFVDSAAGARREFAGGREGGRATDAARLRRRGLGEGKGLWSASDEEFRKAKETYGHKGPYVPLMLFAAGESELASEYDHGSTAYGAFTFTLAKRLRQARRAPSFAALVAGIRRELLALGYQQRPQVTGPEIKREARVPIGRWRESGE